MSTSTTRRHRRDQPASANAALELIAERTKRAAPEANTGKPSIFPNLSDKSIGLCDKRKELATEYQQNCKPSTRYPAMVQIKNQLMRLIVSSPTKQRRWEC
jgi:hypothetical protein